MTEPTGSATEETPQAKHRLGLLRELLRIRMFEERCDELYSAAKIRRFLHLGIGE